MDSSTHMRNALRGRHPWRATQERRRRDARDMERRMRVMEALGDISLTQLPLDALLQALLDSVRRELALETVAVLLPHDGGAVVTARVASGAGADLADTFRVPLGYGFIGEAMRSRKPVIIDDASAQIPHPEYLTPELLARMRLRSAILAPLIVADRPIGAIALVSSEPNRFASRDVRLVELVAGRVAQAIERARTRDEAMRAHERLRFLNDAGVSLNATLDYRATTQRLADILTPTLGAACAIYLLEEDGLLRKAVTRSPARDHPNDQRALALERLVAGLAPVVEARPGDPDCAIGGSVHALTPIFERVALGDGADETASVVSVPLVVRQHALGAYYLVAHPDQDFTAGDMAILQGLAERAAVAIDNARLYLETQEALAKGGAIATQLNTIFTATDVGIFVTDATGAYLRVNPYGAALLGLTEGGDTRGEAPDFELRTPEGDLIPPEREPLYLARTLGQPVEQRVVIHRRGAEKDVEALIRCTPWRDTRNQIAGAIGVFTDITAISALERQKDEFLGIASHELKTPLTSLKILAQLLGRKLRASGDPHDLEQATRMNVSITRMERLIGDLLDVSLMQEGRLALSRRMIDLGALCDDAVSEQRLLTQRVITYSGPEDEPLMVYADPERIYQVVVNLISNALKYSPAKEPVAVRAYRLGGECIVSVHDHGSGVPPEAYDLIFDRFFRVPGMLVQSGSGVGLGLGLSISREIISRHKGRIWVESKLGHGSVFSFALPQGGPA